VTVFASRLIEARRGSWFGDVALNLCRTACARPVSRRWDRAASRKSVTFVPVFARLGLALAMAGFAAGAALAEEKSTDSAQDVSSSVVVVHAKKACFLASARVTGFLVPGQQAVVTLELEGYRVVEIFAREGERVAAGKAIARLERIGTPAPGQPEMPATIQLLAPAGGRVEKSTAQLGAVASPKGEPLFRIAGDEIEMEAEVPSLYLSAIAPKQTVRVQTQSGEVIGQVKRISTEVDKVTQMGHVRAILAPDPSLRIGAFVRATIEAGQSCGVSVPRSAVFYGTDGTTVQVVRAQVIETHRVRIGLLSDLDAEIKEGVREGDFVVAYAGSSLRDGDQVTPKFADDSDRTERH